MEIETAEDAVSSTETASGSAATFRLLFGEDDLEDAPVRDAPAKVSNSPGLQLSSSSSGSTSPASPASRAEESDDEEAAVPRSRSPTQEEEDELLAASPDVNDEGHEERTVEGPSGRSPGPSPGTLGKS
jgi:hypothetical protein